MILLKLVIFHYEKIMRFKKCPHLPGAGRTRVWHHHVSHTPASPGVILLGKMAYHTKQCTYYDILSNFPLILNFLFLLADSDRKASNILLNLLEQNHHFWQSKSTLFGTVDAMKKSEIIS